VRVDRQAVDIAAVRRQRRGTAVQGAAQAVEDTAEHLPRNRQAETLAQKADAGRLVGKAGGSLQDLDHGLPVGDIQHAAQTGLALGVQDLDDLIEADIPDTFDNDQRAVDLGRTDVLQPAVLDVKLQIRHVIFFRAKGVETFCSGAGTTTV